LRGSRFALRLGARARRTHVRSPGGGQSHRRPCVALTSVRRTLAPSLRSPVASDGRGVGFRGDHAAAARFRNRTSRASGSVLDACVSSSRFSRRKFIVGLRGPPPPFGLRERRAHPSETDTWIFGWHGGPEAGGETAAHGSEGDAGPPVRLPPTWRPNMSTTRSRSPPEGEPTPTPPAG